MMSVRSLVGALLALNVASGYKCPIRSIPPGLTRRQGAIAPGLGTLDATVLLDRLKAHRQHPASTNGPASLPMSAPSASQLSEGKAEGETRGASGIGDPAPGEAVTLINAPSAPPRSCARLADFRLHDQQNDRGQKTRASPSFRLWN